MGAARTHGEALAAAVGRLGPARFDPAPAMLSGGVVRIGPPNEAPGVSRASSDPGPVPAARGAQARPQGMQHGPGVMRACRRTSQGVRGDLP